MIREIRDIWEQEPIGLIVSVALVSATTGPVVVGLLWWAIMRIW